MPCAPIPGLAEGFSDYLLLLANKKGSARKQGIFLLRLADNKNGVLLTLADNVLRLTDNSLQTAPSTQIN